MSSRGIQGSDAKFDHILKCIRRASGKRIISGRVAPTIPPALRHCQLRCEPARHDLARRPIAQSNFVP